MSETMGLLEGLALRCEAATEWHPALDRAIEEAVFGHGPIMPRGFTKSIGDARLIWDGWDHCEVYRPDHQTLGWTVYLYGNANRWRGLIDGFAQTEAMAWAAASLRGLALSKGSDV